MSAEISSARPRSTIAMDSMSSSLNITLQTQRMVTQLQTQLSGISMHCGEIQKLCREHADPRRVETEVGTLKYEEKEILTLLRSLRALKDNLRLPEQQQLDGKLRALSEEYARVLQQIRSATTTGTHYCSQMRSMHASLRQSRRGDDPPQSIALGPGLGVVQLLQEETGADETAEEQQLERDVGQLSEMFQMLLEHTTTQGSRIDTLEAHMEAAAAEARVGAVQLTEAAKFSASAVPVAAALLGGALGGPLGLLAGLKGAAALTAVVGAGAGWVTGAWYKRRVHASADAAREELDAKTK